MGQRDGFESYAVRTPLLSGATSLPSRPDLLLTEPDAGSFLATACVA